MKRFIKFAVLLFTCTFVILSSCKKVDEELDQVVVNLTEPTDTLVQKVANGLVVTNATIQGIVVNNIDASFIEGVTVTVSGITSGTTTTDAKGGYSITGLTSGDYTLTYSKEGYAKAFRNVTIPLYADLAYTEVVPNGANFDIIIEGYANLHPLTSTVNGYAFLDNNYPAEGTIVTLTYNDDIAPAFYTATVDEDGFFEFESVPAYGSQVAMYSFPGYNFTELSNGITFNNGQIVPVKTGHNTVTELGSFELQLASSDDYPVGVVDASMTFDPYYGYVNFAPKDPFTITFNQTIDFEKSTFIMFLLDNSDNEVFPVKASFAPTKALCTVEVTPAAPMYVYEDYKIYGIVTLTNGQIYPYNFEFETVAPTEFKYYGSFEVVSTDLASPEEILNYFDNGTDIENVALDRSFTMEFTLPVDEEITEEWSWLGLAEITSPSTYVDVDINVVIDGKVVTITPAEPLKPNAHYVVGWDVYADYLAVNTYHPFRSSYLNLSDQIKFYTVTTPVEIVGTPTLRLTNPNMTINDNTRIIPVTFTSVSKADKYRIEAKDNHNNPEWIPLGSFVGPSPLLDFQEGSEVGIETNVNVTLPNRFDYFYDDNLQTPFSHGTEVSLRVVAYNNDNEVESADIKLKDNTPLTNLQIYSFYDHQNVNGELMSANNTSASDTTMYFGFVFNNSWYVDETYLPTATVYNSDTPVTTMPATFEWTIEKSWDAGRRVYSAKIAVTIPANTNATGYTLRVTGIKDASGNAMTDDVTFNF